jgi:hypothetical protein
VRASTSACSSGSSSARLGPAGHPEGDQRGVVERELAVGGAGEELGVLRVRAGPAALDVGDAELVHAAGDPQLVVDRQRHPLALGAVAQRRVVQVEPPGGRAAARRVPVVLTSSLLRRTVAGTADAGRATVATGCRAAPAARHAPATGADR